LSVASEWDLQIGLHEAELDGKMDKLELTFNAQFLHDLVSVGLDGADAYTENVCNLSRRMAFCNQLKDLSFTIGENLKPFFPVYPFSRDK
jgi:hypothetical protein